MGLVRRMEEKKKKEKGLMMKARNPEGKSDHQQGYQMCLCNGNCNTIATTTILFL